MDLWWTKPAERRPLLKSVGKRPAPAGTAPAVMSHSSIPARPRAKIKATAAACASFQGSYWKESVRGPGGGVRSQKSRIAGKCYDPGTCGQMGIPKEAELTVAQAGRTRTRKVPRPGGDRLAQPIRRMNLAGVPVTVGYCPSRFSRQSET